MTTRREQILGTAAELFAARGFHGVSVADLGAACGITGPALYKHFASKDAVLAEMLVSISRWLLDGGRACVGAADSPAAALAALVDHHVGAQGAELVGPDDDVRALGGSYLLARLIGERGPVAVLDDDERPVLEGEPDVVVDQRRERRRG